MALDVSAWTGVRLDSPIAGGHRNEVWVASRDEERLVARRSRRSSDSLAWELDLLTDLERDGFLVPSVVPTDGGLPSAGGVVVQRWIEGREPSSADDWNAVAAELGRLHSRFAGRSQRPGCCCVCDFGRAARSVDADMSRLPADAAHDILHTFANLSHAAVSVIHGDPGPSNLRITTSGRVALLDWDESRVDIIDLDLANLGVQVLDDADHERAQAVADAWEAANAWTAEPDYARRRLAALRARRVAGC